MFNLKNMSNAVTREYECTGEIKSIVIDDTSSKIIVESKDADRVKVSVDETEDIKYTIEEGAGNLSVTRNKENRIKLQIFNFDEFVTHVVVPKNSKVLLKIENMSGRIEVKDIDATDFRIENMSGGIDISNVSADDVRVTNSSGGITLNNVSSESGIDVHNSSGRIKLVDVFEKGDVNVKNTSGGVNFERLNVVGNITINNTSGSVRGSILGKESDYSIDAKATSGGNNLTNSKGGSKELFIRTTSGGINVDFN